MMHIVLGDILFELTFAEYDTAKYFRHFRTTAASGCLSVPIHISKEELIEDQRLYQETYKDEALDLSLAYIEYSFLQIKISNALLPFESCLYHGVSFQSGDRVFLLTGPSGVGKTTQYKNLKRILGDDIVILNGDKPVFQFGKDEIYVHPSPWMGKEDLGSFRSGVLDSIIFLKQDTVNKIHRMPMQESVLPIFSQFIYSDRSEKNMRMICSLTDRILRSVPVYEFDNDGTESSSRLLWERLLKEI